MREPVNLLVDLDWRFDERAQAEALAALDGAGFATEIRAGADDRTLAWIDETFGGAWSSEALVGSNVVTHRNDAPIGFATFDPHGLRFKWLRGLATEPGVGIFGPFGVDPAYRGGIVGRALLTLALAQLRLRGYTRALIPAVGAAKLVSYYIEHAQAREAERFNVNDFTPQPVRTVVLASGSGTNFQSVLDRVADGTLPLDVAALVTNNAQAFAIERARASGVPGIHVLPWQRKEMAREDYDKRVLEAVASVDPELVLLLGWMHLLDGAFVTRFPNLINIHPAFLPLDPAQDDVGMPDGTRIAAFRGPRAVRDALAAGSNWVGASVHIVTRDTDRGPILVRKPLHVAAGDDEAQVMERLHPIEHQLVDRGIHRWLYER